VRVDLAEVSAAVVSATFAVAAKSSAGNAFDVCAKNRQVSEDSIQVNTPPRTGGSTDAITLTCKRRA
jgi:hypothetical protein